MVSVARHAAEAGERDGWSRGARLERGGEFKVSAWVGGLRGGYVRGWRKERLGSLRPMSSEAGSWVGQAGAALGGVGAGGVCWGQKKLPHWQNGGIRLPLCADGLMN